jgi:uncharacterized membrane protein YgcG
MAKMIQRNVWANPSFMGLLASLLLVLQPVLVGAFPEPQGFVNDFAGVLDDRARTDLQSLMRDTEQQTSVEIALVTVSSLEGMTVEEYASKLFAAWGIGKKSKDNGVLILIAPAERKIRIEVGYGLEPVLPDGLAGEIIRTDFLPAFGSGDLKGGIFRGTRRVIEIVQRNQPLSADERRELAERAESRPPAFLMTPFFGLFIALGAFAAGLGFRSKTTLPLIWGGLFGGVPFVMSLVPFFNASIRLLIPLGGAMLLWG